MAEKSVVFIQKTYCVSPLRLRDVLVGVDSSTQFAIFIIFGAELMRIGIDGRAWQGNLTGVGRYMFELALELDSILPETEFFVYSQLPLAVPVISPRWHFRIEQRRWARLLKGTLWYKLCIDALIRNDKLELFWAASTLLPRLPLNIRTLCTVYDLNHKVVPDSMAPSVLWAHRLFFDRDVLASNAVVAISQGTALRIKCFLGRKVDAVVYPAAGPLFRAPPHEVVQKTLRVHNLQQPYLLAVGTLEPRKNLELLIQVFLTMRQEGLLSKYQLVLVGGAGWKNVRLRELLVGHADKVRVLGYVADEDLSSLYAGSAAFVFPSVYEGFGIPALEARLCGAKVLAADVPEIREACGGLGIFITPDAKGLRDGILQVLAQPHPCVVDDAPSWSLGAVEMASQFRKLASHASTQQSNIV